MAKSDVFALQQSELNGFLFANIGVEGRGMPLSVLSALARHDIDPWQEAARLARLPQTAAVDGLARLIASMPASLWPLPLATPIATRLVKLLPDRSANSPNVAQAIASAGVVGSLLKVFPGLTSERLSAILIATAIAAGAAAMLWRTPASAPTHPAQPRRYRRRRHRRHRS